MFQSIRSILLTWQVLLRLFVAFFVPYVLLLVIMTIAADQVNDVLGGEKEFVRVGLVGIDEVPLDLLAKLRKEGTLIEIEEEATILSLLDEDSIDVGFVFPTNFYADSTYNGTVKAFYNTMQNGGDAQVVFDLLRTYEEKLIAQKFQTIGLDRELLNPISIKTTDTFNPIVMLGRVMDQVKSALANGLNLLFILLVLWLVRNLVLRAAFIAPAYFWKNLICIFIGTLLGMLLVLIGFQVGINSEQEGMIRGVILSMQQLLVWSKLNSILLLWLPIWLFIIGLLGWIVTISKTMVNAYSRTFWVVIVIQCIGILGAIPIKELSILDTYFPLLNVFRMGELSMKGDLDSTMWYGTLAFTIINAMIMIGIWYRQYNKKHAQDLN